ncbi:MAG: hypothetical protein WCQ96_01325 [Patescibacteria group bacterium]
MIFTSNNLPTDAFETTKTDRLIYLAVSYESYIILYAINIELCTIKTNNFYAIGKANKKITMMTPQEKIELFKSIFRGREDVFAVYWKKADKSAGGYTPGMYERMEIGTVPQIAKTKMQGLSECQICGT